MERDRFETLASLFPEDAVFAVDRNRSIIFWSDGAERLLGFQREEVLGQHCLKANRCQTCIRGCGIAEHGRVENVPLTMFRSDGETVQVRKTAQAFFDEDGTFDGGIEVLRKDARLPASPEDAERARVEWALKQTPDDLDAAARLLGVSRATFWRKRKKYGLNP